MQASNLNFTNVQRTSITCNWTAGDGVSILLVSERAIPDNIDPTELVAALPALPQTFNTATDVNGVRPVYMGADDFFNVQGLVKYKLYYFKVVNLQADGTIDQSVSNNNYRSRWTLR